MSRSWQSFRLWEIEGSGVGQAKVDVERSELIELGPALFAFSDHVERVGDVRSVEPLELKCPEGPFPDDVLAG